MTPQEAEDAINAHFEAGWAGLTPVSYENKPFNGEEQENPWITLTIEHNIGTVASLGGEGDRNYRNFGIIQIQVFSPKGGQKRPNTVLANTAKLIFRGKHLTGNLWFRNESVSAATPSGKWYQQNVTAEFIYDEPE